ncbi:hypothetical protein LINGRAHAP2_LOCUS9312 [Linum grandiflorum]
MKTSQVVILIHPRLNNPQHVMNHHLFRVQTMMVTAVSKTWKFLMVVGMRQKMNRIQKWCSNILAIGSHQIQITLGEITLRRKWNLCMRGNHGITRIVIIKRWCSKRV